jgi:plasmid segregation protein ParM
MASCASIVGIDLGNKGMKTSEGIIIESKISTGEQMLKDSVRIRFDGEETEYILGEGEFQTNTNKMEKEGMIVSLYGAIAESTTADYVKVVLGLPISHYKQFKEPLKLKVLENNYKKLEHNGAQRRIYITDIEIVPEGAVAFKSLNQQLLTQIGNQDLVIIDVGGRTTDICLYRVVNGKRQIVKYKTVMVGTLNIYDEISQAVNAHYGLDKTLEDGEQILREGLYLLGEKQDLSFIKSTLKAQTDKIFKELNMNFPITTSQALLIGGGSLTLQGLFKKNLPHVLMANDPIFGNAIGMKKVGEALWLR